MFSHKEFHLESSMAAHSCSPTTQEVEAGGFQGQGICSGNLSQKKKKIYLNFIIPALTSS
jgi:hypothetical protein